MLEIDRKLGRVGGSAELSNPMAMCVDWHHHDTMWLGKQFKVLLIKSHH